MLGQIGNWDGQVDLGFGPEMLAWLDRLGTGRRISLQVFSDRSFLIMPDATGFKVGSYGVRMGYKHHVTVPHDEAGGDGQPLRTVVDLPRFKLHEVRITEAVEGDPMGGLCGSIDQDHQLPWPLLRTANCKAYLAVDVLSHDVYLRLLSVLRTGAPRLGARCPDRLRDMMPRTLWPDALERARDKFAEETQPQKKAA